jgi:hypothetical protein
MLVRIPRGRIAEDARSGSFDSAPLRDVRNNFMRRFAQDDRPGEAGCCNLRLVTFTKVIELLKRFSPILI